MSSDRAVDSFLALSATRLAPRTVDAYRRDLADIAAFLEGSPEKATPERLAAYVASMRARGLAATTIGRRIAALRSFYRHQMLIGARTDNPAAELDLPRRARTLPRTLSPGEAERLLEAASGTAPRALRDRALVELMYGAGLRVSEAVGLDRAAVDLEGRLVRCLGKGAKDRVVPLGEEASHWVARYLRDARPELARGAENALFLSAHGKRLDTSTLRRLLAEGDDPVLRALAQPHVHVLLLEVDVAEVEADRLGAAQSRGVDELDECTVAQRDRAVALEGGQQRFHLRRLRGVGQAPRAARTEHRVGDARRTEGMAEERSDGGELA